MTNKRLAGFSIGILIGNFALVKTPSDSVVFWVFLSIIIIASILYCGIDWEKQEDQNQQSC